MACAESGQTAATKIVTITTNIRKNSNRNQNSNIIIYDPYTIKIRVITIM